MQLIIPRMMFENLLTQGRGVDVGIDFHNKDHGAREVGPTTVQEHIVFLSGQKLTSPQDGAKPSKGVYIKKPPDF